MQHKDLASGRWQKFSLMEQLANVGSEVHRTITWRAKNYQDSQLAFERTLELLDLTIDDQKNRKRLKELLRLRSALVDYFVGENEYGSSDEKWNNYFYSFNYATCLQRMKGY